MMTCGDHISRSTIINQTIKTKQMKKYVLLAGLLAVGFIVKAQTIQSNALKLNPLSIIVKTGNISYERAINSRQSFQVGGFYSGVNLADFNYEGWGITPEYRFYFGGQKQVLNGGYVAPFVRYQDFSISDEASDAKARFSTIGGGAIIGWEKNYKSGFVLDVFAGPSYNSAKFKNGSEDDFDIKGGIKGFGLRSGIAIGFSF
jgi:hypothetical protein